MSGFWAVPRMNGFAGLRARARCSSTNSRGMNSRNWSSLSLVMVLSSWEVRNPSKKCTNGRRLSRVARWAMAAMSCASWTEAELSRHTPVWRTAITSW